MQTKYSLERVNAKVSLPIIHFKLLEGLRFYRTQVVDGQKKTTC
jgi:hypothetical protein